MTAEELRHRWEDRYAGFLREEGGREHEEEERESPALHVGSSAYRLNVASRQLNVTASFLSDRLFHVGRDVHVIRHELASTCFRKVVVWGEEGPFRGRSREVRTLRAPTGIVIGGEPGKRHLLSLAVGDEHREVKHAAAEALQNVSVVRSLWVVEDNHRLDMYAVVKSWEYDNLRPVYEQEREIRERFPDVELGFELLLTDEEEWIPQAADLLLLRG